MSLFISNPHIPGRSYCTNFSLYFSEPQRLTYTWSEGAEQHIIPTPPAPLWPSYSQTWKVNSSSRLSHSAFEKGSISNATAIKLEPRAVSS